MKKNARLISLLIVTITFINFTFPNYIIELEVGRYEPNDSDFKGDPSLRFGGVLANNFGPVEVYAGCKIWTNDYADNDIGGNYTLTNYLNTIVAGARKKIPLSNGKNFRLGGEILIATANYELDYIQSNDDYTVHDMKSIGFGIEAGAVYKIDKYEFFGGINLLILEYEVETIETSSGTFSASELNWTASEKEYDANGLNYKISIGYSF